MARLRRSLILGAAVTFSAFSLSTGWHLSRAAAQQQDDGSDPAAQNMAPADGYDPNAQQAQSPDPNQQQQAAPIERRPPGYDPNTGQYAQQNQYPDQGQQQPQYPQQGQYPDQNGQYAQQDPNQSYAGAMGDEDDDDMDAGQAAMEQADQPPPPLPTYDQPEAPEPNYLWTPGYWAWAPGYGYYWVPGAWVAPPYYGALWTPGYWYFYGGGYRFRHGYWGLHIGYYGGINYGWGYFGFGYVGGYWRGRDFYYNRNVTRVNVVRVTNVYNHVEIVNNYNNRISYNGGRGGVQVRPRPQELAVYREQRTPIMQTQLQVRQQAAQNRAQFFNQNHGRPEMVAAPRVIPADRGIQRPNPTYQPARGYQPQQGNSSATRGLSVPQNRPNYQQTAPPQQTIQRAPYQPQQNPNQNQQRWQNQQQDQQRQQQQWQQQQQQQRQWQQQQQQQQQRQWQQQRNPPPQPQQQRNWGGNNSGGRADDHRR